MVIEDYFVIKRDFIEYLSSLDGDTVKVYLFLVNRQLTQKGIKPGLTLPELARACDVGTQTTQRALEQLTEKKLIEIEKKSSHHIIKVNEYYTDEQMPIPFTYKNTDENKLKTLETEVQRLQLQQVREKHGTQSGIAAKLTDDKRMVVTTIERDLGRAVTTEEAFFLGQLLGAFDPARVKLIWQRNAATAKNPLLALHAILWNNAAGKPMQQKQLIDPPEIRDL